MAGTLLVLGVIRPIASWLLLHSLQTSTKWYIHYLHNTFDDFSGLRVSISAPCVLILKHLHMLCVDRLSIEIILYVWYSAKSYE